MTRDCFKLLRQKIIASVGEPEFKSDTYISAFLRGKDKMYDTNCETTEGVISSEVKVAITLLFMGGGDALDLAVIFDVSANHCTNILYEVLFKWIIARNIGNLTMNRFLGDKESMAKVSAGFSKRFKGVLVGASGVLDGWVVRIVRPG